AFISSLGFGLLFFGRLHQLDAVAVRGMHESDHLAATPAARPLIESGPQSGQAFHIGMNVGGNDAEVLEPEMRTDNSFRKLFSALLAREIHLESIVLRHAADETVAALADLVGQDGEIECADEPISG